MNTLTNINEELFTELAPTEAEVIQGGYNFTGRDYNVKTGKKDIIAEADFALPTLKRDNEMDYVNIESGKWRLYNGSNYSGGYIELGAGYHELKDYYFPRVAQTGEPAVSVGNNVSSLKKV
jgi:hypothetical protein